jgi:hypothetical protein
MFDLQSKITALAENYGLILLLEQNDISETLVIAYLIDEGLIDIDDYFNFDAEKRWWKEAEE